MSIKEDVVHIYTGILVSSKKNEIGSFVVMWMDLESIIQSEVSQKEKNKYHILMHMSEKAMAPHSGTPAWKIPRMEEPGGLQSTRSRRVRHD